MNQIIYTKREDSEFSINLTNTCPNACVFCVKEKSKGWFKEKQSSSIDLFLKSEPSVNEILDAVEDKMSENIKNPVKLIKFCGYGEPILKCDAIVKTTMLIKRYSPNSKVQVNTSGWPYLLQYNNIDMLCFMKDVGIESFSISLNAPNKELYNKIVRPRNSNISESAFDNTIKFIMLTKELGFKVKLTFVDIPLIHDAIPCCINLANYLGVEAIIRKLDEI